jgi:di/tricarboxylate transporter
VNVRDAVNRGVNFFGVTALAVESALGLFEVFNETEWIDRLDDLIIIVLAVVGIVWYNIRNNRFQRSLLPFVLLVVGWVIKMAAVFGIERDDSNAVGPDYGLIVTLALWAIVFGVQYVRARWLVAREESARVEA